MDRCLPNVSLQILRGNVPQVEVLHQPLWVSNLGGEDETSNQMHKGRTLREG